MKAGDGDPAWYVRPHAVMRPGRAAHLLRTTTVTVRRWAEAGLIRFADPSDHASGPYTLYSAEDVRELAELLDGRERPSVDVIRRLRAR